LSLAMPKFWNGEFPLRLEAFTVMTGRHALEFPKHRCHSRVAIIDHRGAAQLEPLNFPHRCRQAPQNRTSRGTCTYEPRFDVTRKISAASSPRPWTFPRNTMWATEYARPRSAVAPTTGGLGDVGVPSLKRCQLPSVRPTFPNHFQHVVRAAAVVEVSSRIAKEIFAGHRPPNPRV